MFVGAARKIVTFLGKLMVEYNHGFHGINTIMISLTNNKAYKGHRTMVGLVGRGNDKSASDDDNRIDVQKWTFLSKFWVNLTHTFYERHIIITIQNIHMPGGVSRTLQALLLEEEALGGRCPMARCSNWHVAT